jgi:UMF1 family MFS transporter
MAEKNLSAKSPLLTRRVVAWALYDWANSAFATTVMVVFFPLFFKQYLTVGQSAATSTFWLGVTNGVASLVLALTAPWLGTLADKSGAHIRLLTLFTAIGIVPSLLLAWVSDWHVAALLFGLASIGFWGGLTFYDSMLVKVAPRDRLDSVSGFGYALGYLGGALLLTVNVLMYGKPEWFGIADKETAVRLSFASVAVWWLVFALPLLRTRPESAAPSMSAGEAWRASIAELRSTIGEVRRYRSVVLFLLAYWMYIDGVNTMMKMAVDYGLALKFPADSLIVGILIIQFIGFPATLLFGWLGDRISPLLGIFVAIAVYSGVTLYAVFMTHVSEFYVMAVAIGCVQGAVQSMSRSYYGRLIPVDRAGEFYGFYNMMGKAAAVLGPMLMGVTALLTGNPRISILSLVVLFAGGAVMLWWASRATAPPAGAEVGLRALGPGETKPSVG